MTKLLILSDSHNSRLAIENILAAEADSIDALIFLGDGLRDLEQALTFYPSLRAYAVAGNCDFGALEPLDGLAAFDGVVVFYTHGHMYGVKYDLDTLADAAAARGANVALFGHTHIPVAEERGGVFLFNPGSCGRCYTGPNTYGILTLDRRQGGQPRAQRGTQSMSINEVRWLSECGSTNAYAKEHFEEFGPVGAVYTTNQTAGRGRLGRSWVNAEGRALYYTAAIREPLAQPATLPLLASLAVRDQLSSALRRGLPDQMAQRPAAERQEGRGHPLRERQLRLPACRAGASSAASASIWHSPRAISTPQTCPTAPPSNCRARKWTLPPTPSGWPRL